MNRQEAVKALMAAGKSSEVQKYLADKAGAAQKVYRSIDSDESLSDKGKMFQLAAAYTRARQEVDKHLTDMADRVVRIDRHDAEWVFGTKGLSGDAASLVISRRDAADRVARVESRAELQDLLRRATRSGDEVLARAVAERAVENLDDKTMHQFIADRPDLERAAERLWDVQRAESDTFGMTMHFANLRPGELMGMSQESIDELAQDEPGPEPTAPRQMASSGSGTYWSSVG